MLAVTYTIDDIVQSTRNIKFYYYEYLFFDAQLPYNRLNSQELIRFKESLSTI